MSDDGWHFSVADGKTSGPVSLAHIRNAVASGQLRQDDLVWHESLGDWKRIASVSTIINASSAGSSPPPIPPPVHQPQVAVGRSPSSFDAFIDTARERVESFGSKMVSPASTEVKTDTWGTVGSVAGAVSGGLLLVGLCFTPMACCAVPVSIGGIASALFSDNRRLRKIGLIGNSIILFLSLAIVIWLSFSMAMTLHKIERM
jgi:hypothetical protein